MPRVLSLSQDVDAPMPAGGEDKARNYYGRIFGLRETMKAPGERGVWFQVGDKQLRLRVAQGAPQPSSTPLAELAVDNAEAFRNAVDKARFRVWDAKAVAGSRGFLTADPFGNRFEVRERKPA